MMLKEIRLVLFDLDGTLVDSEKAIVESFRRASEITGIEIDLNKLRDLIGYPLMDVVRGSLVNEVDETKLTEYIRIRRKIMSEIWRDQVRLYPDVIPVLEELKKRHYILGTASSSIISRIREFLEFFKITHYFDIISGVIEGKIRGKPYPDTILYAIAMAGVNPFQTVYIGDMEVDCISADRAGTIFIRIARRSNQWKCAPLMTIRSLIELLDILP